MPAHPELPFVVVRILVQVLLDRYRAIRRRVGEFRIDLVTSGWSRRLRGRRANAADADTADKEQADQRCSNLHFLAPLARSAISSGMSGQKRHGGRSAAARAGPEVHYLMSALGQLRTSLIHSITPSA